ncbi:hypothetical protein CPB83DRAFT_842092 [Crepidotus variabilis]|uniref:MYND-type domain-containing protein n=1 Tax=Crepidotus variabilis TaxID=179855 RepID=A0A9P6ET16_9AGAR|nr:hypothetical protein CPB83DRAFT_842092 [Crepidotus variabilis]
MGDYAEIFPAHTQEQTLRWKNIAITKPKRVARVLVLRAGDTTKEGDNLSDILPALVAVKEIMAKTRPGVENKEWAALVSGGIADALCKAVCGMVTILQPLTTMPPELKKKVKNELQTSYFAPLEILCDACCHFQYPPTQTDKKVIAAIRKHWSEMMELIWTSPGNTLRPEDSHTRERIAVSQMVWKNISVYPSFMSILYHPSDLTIQIIARHWKHAQKTPDIMATAATLSEVLSPSHPRIVAYMNSQPAGLASSSSIIVSKILVGLGPTDTSPKQQQVKIFTAKFAEHLTRLNIRCAGEQLEFFMNLLSAAEKGASEPELPKAVLKSAALWNAVIRLLKKTAKPEPASEQEPRVAESPQAEKLHRVRAIANCMNMLAHILHTATFANPQECGHLIRIWANENLFGVIEDIIDILIDTPGMTMHLTRIASIIVSTAEKAPSLLQAYRSQFPRWRLFATLVKRDFERQQATGLPGFPMPGQLPHPSDHFWDECAWHTIATLQYRCTDKTECSKRGCVNTVGSVVCVCQSVKYCSEACKTKDAKEHKYACGMMKLFEEVGKRGPQGVRT